MYFNENDPFAAQWLRNLFPTAIVDARSIREIQPGELSGHLRCHFFGGIGGWEYALQLAGWPAGREVWTGSCPCQPFSSAGKRKGTGDSRHLWPEFRRLIAERRPATVFGEQVESKDGRAWLAGVRADLEELGYRVGATDLCAAGVAAPHRRQRLYWVAHRASNGHRAPEDAGSDCAGEAEGRVVVAGGCCTVGGMANASGPRIRDCRPGTNDGAACGTESNGQERQRVRPDAGDAGGLGNTKSKQRHNESDKQNATQRDEIAAGVGGIDQWHAAAVIHCRDARARRISSEPGDVPLAHGIPRDVGQRFPELRHLAANARRNRVGRLRGYGNAIVPQVAAMFVQAFMEAEAEV